MKHKVAAVLIMDGVSFCFKEEEGISFTAPDFYVERLVYRLMNCYGVSVKPNFEEVK